MPFSEVLSLIRGVFNVTLFEINKQPITVSNLIMFVLVISSGTAAPKALQVSSRTRQFS